MSASREGFTIDVVARVLRKTILNPFITLPAAISSYWASRQTSLQPASKGLVQDTLVCLCVLSTLGIIFEGVEFLNKMSNNNWTNKSRWDSAKEIVLITGGSSGIGAKVAQQLLARDPGTQIVIIDYVPLYWAPFEAGNVKYYQCDLSDSSRIRTVCEKIRNEVGHPTVLINNAGISRGATICDGSYADVEITIRTNLIAPFLLVKEFAPEMVRRNHGHIVNISSMSAFLPPARVADYAATKAGLIALHEALQLEFNNEHKANRIRLSLVVLSFARTPLFKGKTNQSNFFFPLLEVETVSEAIVGTLLSGYGKIIFMPGIMRYIAIMKGGPEWLWRLAREGTGRTHVDFKGRQKIDTESGKLLST